MDIGPGAVTLWLLHLKELGVTDTIGVANRSLGSQATREVEMPPSLRIDARGVATVALNRPFHHNRLEPDDVGILLGIFGEVAADPSIRAVVLSATGRTFSAGYDLADLGKPMPGGGEGGIALLAELINMIESCRPPTLCALNGPVFGGGTDLALACDIRIGIPACRLMMPAGRFGLHYYHGGLRRYVERLGLGAAKRLFLLAETIDAGEMLRIGYLDEIVPDLAALEARIAALVEGLLSAADPDVVASMKRCLNLIAAGHPDEAAASEAWTRTRRSPAVGAAVASARAKK